MNRLSASRRFLFIGGFLFLALVLIFLVIAARPSQSVPMAAINAIDAELIKEGFKLDQNLMMVDEIVIGRATPAKRWVLSRIYPDYRSQSANRLYSKDGAKLAIDFGMRGGEAVNVSLPADPALCARARKIARELSAVNPNLSISLRTNETVVAKGH